MTLKKKKNKKTEGQTRRTTKRGDTARNMKELRPLGPAEGRAMSLHQVIMKVLMMIMKNTDNPIAVSLGKGS